MAKKILKIKVYDDGTLKFKKEGAGEPVIVDARDMDGFNTTQISEDPNVPIFHANPTWVFIGGRWVRIG